LGIVSETRRRRLDRLEWLAGRGEDLVAGLRRTPGDWVETPRGSLSKGADRYVLDRMAFAEWRADCVLFLGRMLRPNGEEGKVLDTFRFLDPRVDSLVWGIASLRSVRDRYRAGDLEDPDVAAELRATADLVRQADDTLNQGQGSMFDHVAPAVLAGAALERGLKILHDVMVSGSTRPPKQEPATPERMILALKRRNVVTEEEATELAEWAAVRIHALRGNFDAFDRPDVTRFVTGLDAFLAARLF
jgi:hypothetical protein